MCFCIICVLEPQDVIATIIAQIMEFRQQLRASAIQTKHAMRSLKSVASEVLIANAMHKHNTHTYTHVHINFCVQVGQLAKNARSHRRAAKSRPVPDKVSCE